MVVKTWNGAKLRKAPTLFGHYLFKSIACCVTSKMGFSVHGFKVNSASWTVTFVLVLLLLGFVVMKDAFCFRSILTSLNGGGGANFVSGVDFVFLLLRLVKLLLMVFGFQRTL